MIVVDASLAVKWFLNEAESEKARRFLNDHAGHLYGPDLLTIEVSRALVAAVNARRASTFAFRNMIAKWLDSVTVEALVLRQIDTRLIKRGVDIALDLGHPLADCLYLALAIELDCDLVTCDVRFRDKATPHYPRVKLLADFN